MIKNILFLLSTLHYIRFSKLKALGWVLLSFVLSRSVSVFESHLKPLFVSIEPSDFCQLSCPECPVGMQRRRTGKKMDLPLFRSTIDAIKTHVFHVIFYFQGEPLLHQSLPEMIQYAHKAGIFTSTSTNGQLLSSVVAEKLVLSGLDKIIISIDGATQEVYEKYRIGGKLDRAIEGAKLLNYWKQKHHSLTPFIEIQTILFSTNEHQIKAIKQLTKKLKANRLVLKTAQLYNFENGNDLMPKQKKYSRYEKLDNGTYKLKGTLKNRCFRLWSGSVIGASGKVLPCCFDKNATHDFGNLSHQDFQTAFQSSQASTFRNSILQNRIQHEICRNCTSR
ncbi:MAG: hypothetical protein AUK44_09055 [Porphyromonadaceae bacterium CG2_30_38_12]|nr:MAG: hypothetical protein AUK44_09055 [Porphyromonadaceae bacterium CG2_30_38_12]